MSLLFFYDWRCACRAFLIGDSPELPTRGLVSSTEFQHIAGRSWEAWCTPGHDGKSLLSQVTRLSRADFARVLHSNISLLGFEVPVAGDALSSSGLVYFRKALDDSSSLATAAEARLYVCFVRLFALFAT
jgi:hypothetical protein